MRFFHDDVCRLLRSVAADVIMPRFGGLASGEIFEKTPGELVTVVDRDVERLLSEALSALDSSARTLGEEACSADPSLMDRIGEGRIWLIDPIDGTGNFAAGRGPFGVMVALVEDGETVASWILDPLADRLCYAQRGAGAYVNGERIYAESRGHARPVAALATQFLGEAERNAFHARAAVELELVPIPRCAAEHYPRICLGENDMAFFQRTLPWDHAAGALLLTEAGGAVARWNGTPYRVDDGGVGILAANSAEHLEQIQHIVADLGLGCGTKMCQAQS